MGERRFEWVDLFVGVCKNKDRSYCFGSSDFRTFVLK